MATTPLAEAGTAASSGTTLAAWPDAAVFGAAEFSFDALVERFRELAFLNQGLRISLTDLRRPDEPRSARLCFPGGARDFVGFLTGRAAASAPKDSLAFECEVPRTAGAMEVALSFSGLLSTGRRRPGGLDAGRRGCAPVHHSGTARPIMKGAVGAGLRPGGKRKWRTCFMVKPDPGMARSVLRLTRQPPEMCGHTWSTAHW